VQTYSDLYDDYLKQLYFTCATHSWWPESYIAMGLIKEKTPNTVIIPPQFTCPSENRLSLNGNSFWNSWKGTHYSMNHFLAHSYEGSNSAPVVYRKFSSAVQPSSTYAIADKGPAMDGTNSRATALRARFGLPAIRHGKFFNVVMLDGHAEGKTDYLFRGLTTDWKDYSWAPTRW